MLPKSVMGLIDMTGLMTAQAITLNAKVGAVALGVGALGLMVLAFVEVRLVPISVLVLGILVFGLWALSDEMGMKKPLVRGAFLAFGFAAMSRFQALLGLNSETVARYYLAYAFFALLALLLWSAAFLHRRKELKIVGAVGVFAAALPIVLLSVGHVVVGVGGAFGVTALFAMIEGAEGSDFVAIRNIDLILSAWSGAGAGVLWRGYV